MKKVNRIESHMTQYPTLAMEETTLNEALEYMEKSGIRHLPVLHKERVVGVVSERDLRQYAMISDSMDILVADVMTKAPFCVYVGTPLSDVAHEMAKHKYGCAVVLDRADKVVGIFTTTDGMRVLSEILTNSPEGVPLRKLGIESLLRGDALL